MSAHTPGPWKPSAASRAVTNAAGWDIAVLPEPRGPIGIDETTANAKLIAAAPELLAALEEALEFVEDHEDVVDGDYGEQKPNRAMQLAPTLREAIAKAGGTL